MTWPVTLTPVATSETVSPMPEKAKNIGYNGQKWGDKPKASTPSATTTGTTTRPVNSEIIETSPLKPSVIIQIINNNNTAPATETTATKSTNLWKIAAIVCGIIAIVSLVALAVLFVPPVGAAMGTGALLMAKVGMGASATVFGALAIGFGIKAHLVDKAQAEAA